MNRAALAIAVILAWALARRVPSPRQRAIAATLAGLLALDVCRWLSPWLSLRVGLFVGWYALTAWCVWTVLRKEQAPRPATHYRSALDLDLIRGGRWAAAIAIALALVAAFAVTVRLGLTVELSRASFVLALAVQALAAVLFLSRGKWPDDAQRVALILAASSVVDAMPGPWLLGEPARDWNVGRAIAVVTWLVIAWWEAKCLIRVRAQSRRSARSPSLPPS